MEKTLYNRCLLFPTFEYTNCNKKLSEIYQLGNLALRSIDGVGITMEEMEKKMINIEIEGLKIDDDHIDLIMRIKLKIEESCVGILYDVRDLLLFDWAIRKACSVSSKSQWIRRRNDGTILIYDLNEGRLRITIVSSEKWQVFVYCIDVEKMVTNIHADIYDLAERVYIH